MRIALIPVGQPVAEDEDVPRAMLAVAGRRVARHQLDCALILGCERIVIHRERHFDGFVSLRGAAERGGAKYCEIAGLSGLRGLIGAADELIVFADGLLPDPEIMRLHFAKKRGILTLPADVAVPAGLERIDGELGWAGAMVIRGEAVERTSFLPDDSDPVSALLRVALQLGTRVVPLPGGELRVGYWHQITTEADAERSGDAWLRRYAAPAGWSTPGRAATDRFALRHAHLIGELPGGGAFLQIAAFALMIAVAALGWYNHPAWAFLALSFAGIVFAAGETQRRLEDAGEGQSGKVGLLSRIFPWLTDLALIPLSAVAISGDGLLADVFVPAMALGLLRITSHFGSDRLKAATKERITLCLLLAACTVLGWLAPVLQVLALVLMILLLVGQRDSRITRD